MDGADGSALPLAAAEFLGEARFIAARQQPSLLDPAIAADPPGEAAQQRVDPLDLGILPCRNLRERRDPLRTEHSGDLGPQYLDPRQIVAGGCRCIAFFGQEIGDTPTCTPVTN